MYCLNETNVLCTQCLNSSHLSFFPAFFPPFIHSLERFFFSFNIHLYEKGCHHIFYSLPIKSGMLLLRRKKSSLFDSIDTLLEKYDVSLPYVGKLMPRCYMAS